MKNNVKSASLKKANRSRAMSLVVFLGPFLLVFFVFTILPVLVSILVSLTNFNMLEMPGFVGLDNYAKLFLNDSVFTTAIQNTMIISVITGPVGYLLCFGFAWLVNEIPPKPRAFMTLLFYAPSLSGGMSAVWALLFSNDSEGYINAWLQEFDIISEPIRWTVDTDYMMPVCIIIILWQSLGTTFLTFIAGLQTVNRSLYEAGAVDGIKNRWQELYFITLPEMRGQLMFGAILAITGAFGVDGIITGIFGFPTQSYALHTIMHHLHDYGNVRYEMGYACAIATLLFLISIIANRVVQFLLDRVGK